MRFFVSMGRALVGALVAVLLAMLLSHVLGVSFQPWVSICLAVGCALGIGLKTQWQLSRGGGAALVGVLAGVGIVVGMLLSAHA
ncbi:hypothetical protein [Rhodanobacter aciditrophus]|uniref:hypothetical protein n=1 Tax=Rhodanobacter aciditrophus TaxID=1623218 RepID=UPI003CEEA9BE